MTGRRHDSIRAEATLLPSEGVSLAVRMLITDWVRLIDAALAGSADTAALTEPGE